MILICCNHALNLTSDFRGGLLEAPLYPLKPGVSRGPPGLSGGPGPLGPPHNSTTGYIEICSLFPAAAMRFAVYVLDTTMVTSFYCSCGYTAAALMRKEVFFFGGVRKFNFKI